MHGPLGGPSHWMSHQKCCGCGTNPPGELSTSESHSNETAGEEQKANRFTLFVHRRTIDAGGGFREFLEAQGCGITYWSNFGQSRYATLLWTKRFKLMTCKESPWHNRIVFPPAHYWIFIRQY